MFSFLSLPLKIAAVLEANVSPREVAAGVCLGLFLGLIPLNGPMTFVLVVFFFVFKLNRASTVLVLPLIKLFYVLGGYKLADAIGSYLLMDADFLIVFWRFVAHVPVIALLDLNNTLVAGGLALGAILSVPIYPASIAAAAAIQRKYAERFKDHAVMKFYRKTQKARRAADIAQKVKNKFFDHD